MAGRGFPLSFIQSEHSSFLSNPSSLHSYKKECVSPRYDKRGGKGEGGGKPLPPPPSSSIRSQVPFLYPTPYAIEEIYGEEKENEEEKDGRRSDPRHPRRPLPSLSWKKSATSPSHPHDEKWEERPPPRRRPGEEEKRKREEDDSQEKRKRKVQEAEEDIPRSETPSSTSAPTSFSSTRTSQQGDSVSHHDHDDDFFASSSSKHANLSSRLLSSRSAREGRDNKEGKEEQERGEGGKKGEGVRGVSTSASSFVSSSSVPTTSATTMSIPTTSAPVGNSSYTSGEDQRETMMMMTTTIPPPSSLASSTTPIDPSPLSIVENEKHPGILPPSSTILSSRPLPTLHPHYLEERREQEEENEREREENMEEPRPFHRRGAKDDDDDDDECCKVGMLREGHPDGTTPLSPTPGKRKEGSDREIWSGRHSSDKSSLSGTHPTANRPPCGSPLHISLPRSTKTKIASHEEEVRERREEYEKVRRAPITSPSGKEGVQHDEEEEEGRRRWWGEKEKEKSRREKEKSRQTSFYILPSSTSVSSTSLFPSTTAKKGKKQGRTTSVGGGGSNDLYDSTTSNCNNNNNSYAPPPYHSSSVKSPQESIRRVEIKRGKPGEVVRVSLSPLASPPTAISLRTHRPLLTKKKLHRVRMSEDGGGNKKKNLNNNNNNLLHHDNNHNKNEATSKIDEEHGNKNMKKKTVQVSEVGVEGKEMGRGEWSMDGVPPHHPSLSLSDYSRMKERSDHPSPPPSSEVSIPSDALDYNHHPVTTTTSSSSKPQRRRQQGEDQWGEGSCGLPSSSSRRGSLLTGTRSSKEGGGRGSLLVSVTPIPRDASLTPDIPVRSSKQKRRGSVASSCRSSSSVRRRRGTGGGGGGMVGSNESRSGRRYQGKRSASKTSSIPVSTEDFIPSGVPPSYSTHLQNLLRSSSEMSEKYLKKREYGSEWGKGNAQEEEKGGKWKSNRDCTAARTRRGGREGEKEKEDSEDANTTHPTSPGPLPPEASGFRGTQGGGGGGGGGGYSSYSSRCWVSTKPGTAPSTGGSAALRAPPEVPFFIGRGTIGIKERQHPELYQFNPPLSLMQWTVIYRKREFEERQLKRRAAYQAWRAAALGRPPSSLAKIHSHRSREEKRKSGDQQQQSSSSERKTTKRIATKGEKGEGGAESGDDKNCYHHHSDDEDGEREREGEEGSEVSFSSENVWSLKWLEEACQFNGDKGKYNNTNRKTVIIGGKMGPEDSVEPHLHQVQPRPPSSSRGPHVLTFKMFHRRGKERAKAEEQRRRDHEAKILQQRRQKQNGEAVQLPPEYYRSAHQRLQEMNVSGAPAAASAIQVQDHYKAQKMGQLQLSVQRADLEEARRLEGSEQRRATAEAVAASRAEILEYNKSCRDLDKIITARRWPSKEHGFSQAKKDRMAKDTGHSNTNSSVHHRDSLPTLDGRRRTGAGGGGRLDEGGSSQPHPYHCLDRKPPRNTTEGSGRAGGPTSSSALSPTHEPLASLPFSDTQTKSFPPLQHRASPQSAPHLPSQTHPPTRPTTAGGKGAYLRPPGSSGGSSVQQGPSTTHLVDEIQMWKKTFHSPFPADVGGDFPDGTDRQRRQAWREQLEKQRLELNTTVAEQQRDARHLGPLARERWCDSNLQKADEERAEKVLLACKREEVAQQELAYKEKVYTKQRGQSAVVREAMSARMEERRLQAEEIHKVEALLHKEREMANAQEAADRYRMAHRGRVRENTFCPTFHGEA